MKEFAHYFPGAAKLLVMTAVGGFYLLGLNMQATTLAAGNVAPTSPTKIATVRAAQAQATAYQDIRDIRPPYHIPPGWLWLVWTAGGLALVTLGYGAWRWRHRLGMRVKLPYELALEQLEKARRLMQPEQARAFSIAVSEVVRDYIEKCFPVRAAHRTTDEFLRDLATRRDSPLIAHQPMLADFLHHCDLAKFARWILSVPQMEAMLQSAGVFIVATGKPAFDISVPSVGSTSSRPSLRTPAGVPASVTSTHDATASVTAPLNAQVL